MRKYISPRTSTDGCRNTALLSTVRTILSASRTHPHRCEYFFSLVAGKKPLPAGSAARACDKLSCAFSVILPVRISGHMKSGRYYPEGEKWRITRPRPCSGGVQSDLQVPSVGIGLVLKGRIISWPGGNRKHHENAC